MSFARLQPLALAVHISVAALTAAAPAAIAQQAAARHFDIEAGPLADALNRFAQQAGVALVVDAQKIDGLRTRGISGSFTVDDGFRALLDGTGFEVVPQGNGGYTLRETPPREKTLAAVKVSAAVTGTTTEGSGSYAANTVSYGKGQALKNTPQTVSVITRQRIEDQGLVTLDDVLDQVPGVTRVRGDTASSSYKARGFTITNIMVDGSASLDASLNTDRLDMALYDHVEVLRGADALFGNAGEAGGAVNLVRKKPTDALQVRANASAGRWNTYRGEADVAGPLTADGAIRGRLVVAYEQKDYFYEVSHSDKPLIYGIADMKLGEQTLLSIGGNYSREDATYMRYGLPRYSNGDDIGLPRSFFLGTDDDTYLSKNGALFVRLEHAFNENWALNAEANYFKSNNYRKDFLWAGAIDPVTKSGLLADWGGASYQYINTQKTIDLMLKGSFDALGRMHQLIVGGNWSDNDDPGTGTRRDDYFLVDNIFEFDPGAYKSDAPYARFFTYAGRTKQKGIYTSLALQATDALKLYAGGRLSWYEYSYELQFYDIYTGENTGNYLQRFKDDRVITPYAGAIYALTPQWNAYAGVSETYKSQADKLKGPRPGSPLDPITGTAYEIGVKGELLDGNLNAAFAVYRIERKGEGVADGPTDDGAFGSSCCYLDDGKVRSSGFDAELNGALTENWQVSLGYTYNDNENTYANIGRYSTDTPRHMVKLWSVYRLPGALSAFRIGGGATAQSRIYNAGTASTYNPATGYYDGDAVPFRFTEPGRVVADLFGEYRIDAHWVATLNVSNLFDKTYYQTLGQDTYGGNWYGEPRSWTLRVNYEM